ncbi:PREDICTED: L-type lectin-domain containing receptor kinase IX.1-like [Fragaria vesca subsp. vesca]
MNLLPYLRINILLFLLSLPYASPVSFQILQFSANATGISYEGDAEPVDGVVELTNKVQYVGRVGRATYAERVPLWDSHHRKFSDFNTKFSFLIDKKGQGTYGSGFAFYLAPWGYQIPPNSGGGFIGLFNNTSRDIPGNQVVLVEFDYYVDEWDPSYQHVGININSIDSVAETRWNPNLHNGEITESYKNHHANSTREITSLSYIIDLTNILPEWISVGFSASTSQYGERHKILSWQFYSSLDGVLPPNKIFAEVIRILVGSVIILILAVFIWQTVVLWWDWLRRIIRERRETISSLVQETSDISSTLEDDESDAGSLRFCDPDITHSFSNDERNAVDVDIATKTTETNCSLRHITLV